MGRYVKEITEFTVFNAINRIHFFVLDYKSELEGVRYWSRMDQTDEALVIEAYNNWQMDDTDLYEQFQTSEDTQNIMRSAGQKIGE